MRGIPSISLHFTDFLPIEMYMDFYGHNSQFVIVFRLDIGALCQARLRSNCHVVLTLSIVSKRAFARNRNFCDFSKSDCFQIPVWRMCAAKVSSAVLLFVLFCKGPPGASAPLLVGNGYISSKHYSSSR